MRDLPITITMATALLSGCVAGESQLVERTAYTLDAESLDRLSFDVGAGALDVAGDPEATRVEVTVELRSNRALLTEDQRAIDSLDVRLEAVEADAELTVRFDEPPPGYFADVYVTLPARMSAAGRDDSGDLSIRDVAGVGLEDASGEIELRRIGGAVRVDDASGGLVLEQVSGAVEIVDDSGGIVVVDAERSVTIRDQSGDIEVRRVAEAVTIDDDSGDIVAVEIGGDVSIADGSGSITVQTDGRFELRSDESGSVTEL